MKEDRPISTRCNAILTSLATLVLLVSALPLATGSSGPDAIREESMLDALPRIEVVEGSFKRNTTLVATLVDFDVPSELAESLATLIQPVFDVRGFRSGKTFKLEKDTDGALRAFEYKISDEKILEVQRGLDAYEARVATLDLESRDTVITAEITASRNSLYAALADHEGNPVQLAEKVASIFAWDVDFNSDMQLDDRIRIVVPAYYYEGTFVKWGDIQAAELVNSRKTYRAFRYEGSYYDAKGNAMKRALLASPLPFNPRVTSGFSRRRLHPILGTRRPHLAVDYGAPTGTKVQAVANGTVTFAGWDSGYGNLVQIRHSGGLTTGYAHLSRIAVRAGSRVDQGDLIGNVGQTGLATGPHLHFMMTKGGRPIDPRSMKSEPPIPINAGLLPSFLAHIAPLEGQLGPVHSALTNPGVSQIPQVQ
ncbi:MAG TPA: peptidoglycan DD-metalloendopeptidase family protein [Terriglobia bacterium]|nr:peptidoglycan DD-metalloendopeptidase family protein [Terriglobia bacterium]